MKYFLTILFFTTALFSNAASNLELVVSKDGKANYHSIQDAINSISSREKSIVTIQIKNGVYKEKIFLKKSNIIFKGESREKTIIEQSVARDEWRCTNSSDWGVATINVDSCSNIQFINLTVINNYGSLYPGERPISCLNDSSGKKIIRSNGHQMAFRSFAATKLQFRHCRFVAYGGDTMSPWNTVDGMFYFNDCIFEGGVDLFCPRGWSLAENCLFIARSGNAIIWHDGTGNESAKSVWKNCKFEGYDGFKLGRYHRDAQFYLVDCSFAANMSNEDIYLVPTTNTIVWGRRIYYMDCKKEGVSENLFANNIEQSGTKIAKQTINSNWVFEGKWNPQKSID